MGKKTDGVAMGSLLSPVIANCYYEKAVTASPPPLKPDDSFSYLQDTYVIWPHGLNKLKDFLHQLISIHQSIQFTM
jgi:hypothetical protein